MSTYYGKRLLGFLSIFVLISYFGFPLMGASISFGQTVSDSLALGEVDTFTFSGTAGDKVVITMSDISSPVSPRIRLHGPDDTLLSDTWNYQNAEIVSNLLPSTGTYTIFASDYAETNSGDYNLTLERLNPGTGSSISFGETAMDTLVVIGDLNTHTFSGTAGMRVVIRMGATSDFFYTRIRLYGPDGTELNDSGSSGSYAEIVSNPLPNTGTYTILANDRPGIYSGGYNLTLERLNPGSGPSISLGETISDELLIGDLNTRTFTAAVGDKVIIKMSRISDYIETRVRLYSPNGTELYNSWDYLRVEIISNPLPSSGTYTIVASDRYGYYGGNYNLTLEAFNSNSGTVITFGETISSSVLISDIDVYAFAASAGNKVVIRASKTSPGNLTPHIRLYGPDDTELKDSFASSNTDLISDPLPSTGTYIIVFTDKQETNGGDYNLTLDRLNPGSGPSISFKQTVSRHLIAGDLDTYTFSGSEGNKVIIRMADTSTFLEPRIRFYGQDGIQLNDSWDGSNVEIISDPLPSTGTYTILVSDRFGYYGGDYNLTLELLDGGISPSISYGQTMTGHLEGGNLDTYTFSGTAGDKVVIIMGRASGSLNPHLRLYDSSGIELDDSWGNSKAEIIIDSLPDNGTYTILGGDYYGSNSGDYSLTIDRLNPGSGSSISFGQIKSGSFVAGDLDTYTFAGNAGNKVVIRMVSISKWPHIRLFGPTGVELSNSWSGSKAEIISDSLPSNGTYTILVCGYYGSYSGSYNLALECLNPPNGTSISSGQTISDNMLVGDLNTHIFSGKAGDKFVIMMGRASGSLKPHIRLYDSTGNELYSSWSGSKAEIISDSLPSSGTYTILACDYYGINSGEYNLTIDSLNPGSGSSVSFGQTVSGHLVAGDLDTHIFIGNAGNKVVIRMNRMSDFLRPHIRLFDPAGVELNSSWGDSKSEIISDSLSSSGTYTILACDYYGSYSGDYNLTLERLGPNLELTQHVDKSFVWHGAELTYTTTYINTGDADASNVVIEISLPSTLKLVGGSISNGGTYESSTRRISWNVGSVPAEAKAQTVTFRAKVASGIAGGTKIAITAQISSLEKPEPVTASVTITIVLPKITSISPDNGGNAGSVTVIIYGKYLDPDAEVKLSRSGETDIMATYVDGSLNGTRLTALLDLSGKTPGSWDLVVTNLGGGSDLLSNAFVIESGGESNLWVEIVGQQQFRVGRKSTLQVSYGNSGSISGPSSAIWISPPADCTIQVNLPSVDPSTDYSTFFESDGNELFVLVGTLYPEENGNFTFTIKPNQEGSDQVTARMVVADISGSNSMAELTNGVLMLRAGKESFEGTWHSPENGLPPEGSMVIRLSTGLQGAPGHVAIYIGGGWAIELTTIEGEEHKYKVQKVNILEEWLGDGSDKDKGKYLGAWEPSGMDQEKRNNIINITTAHLDETGNYLTIPINIPFYTSKNCILFVKEIYGNENVGLDTSWWNPLIGPAEIYQGASHQKWPGGITAYGVIQSIVLAQTAWLSPLSIVSHQVQFSMSWDPNDKSGPTGHDPDESLQESRKRFVLNDHSFPYMVQFENLENATAAVQDMQIIDQLDSNLDWSTFSFDTIQIGTYTIAVPKGSQSFSTNVDFRPEMPAIVEIGCTFNSSTGEAHWLFRGKDPSTGELADFLPPNTESVAPKGQGWVLYSVRPKGNLATGTVIRNKATIDFEVDVPPEPMDTPDWINTIDITKPESNVLALSPTQNSLSFPVQWEGIDEHAGIQSYTIYVSDNGGSYDEWLTSTTETSGTFSGTPGHSYSFYSIATDNVGNLEDAPSGPDTSTTISQSGSIVININRTTLNFGALSGSMVTHTQDVLVSSSNGGLLNWTATPDQDWLQVSPTNGTGDSIMSVSVDASGISKGTYNGSITVTDPNASNSPQTVAVTLNVYGTGTSSEPFGEFATPIHGSTVRSSIPVTGWVIDDIGVESVKIYRKEGNSLIYIGDAIFVEGARPDVEQAYPDYPFNYKAGWGYMMLTNFLPNGGNGTFNIHAIAADTEGHEVTLGIKTITCDNANAVKPFGAIDTPIQGGTASGSSFRNWGWVLTPLPNSIPTDGSTINVIVDGVELGHPAYNNYRADIADLFPDYTNSNGAIGYFDLDTTSYENGVHTIAWIAADDAGNTDGIGSRYLLIQNGSAGNRAYGKWSTDVGGLRTEDGVGYSGPVGVIKGYKKDRGPQKMYPDEKGNIIIEIKELEPLEIRFVPGEKCAGYQIVGNHLRTLPVGSTLDTKRGVFYWHPGPGFFGEYRFIIVNIESTGKVKEENIVVKIVPRF